MVAQPYWINKQLAIVARPRGGDWLQDEMLALSAAGIDVVVSMLESTEAEELGLEHEQEAATSAGLRFVGFPIRDRGVPDTEPFREFLKGLEDELVHHKRVGVHCRGCIGRSSVLVASLLIRAGVPHAEAWRRIEDARGAPVPDTLAQLEWVESAMRPLA